MALRQLIRDFDVPGDSFDVPGLWIFPNRMLLAFTP
jgi:hypothetical protein